MTDIIELINQKFDTFTHSQKKVASYILDYLDNVAFDTLEDLAAKIGVSTTTIIRFSRTLDYSGYSEMQKDIQNAIKYKDSLPHRVNKMFSMPGDTLLKNIFENELNNINKTLAAQSEEDLKETIDLISDSNKVYLIGMRSSFSLAFYMASRLGQIKKNIHLVQSPGMMFPEEISGAQKGDVCIVFLFPRYSKTTSTLISWLKQKGVKIILFTSLNNTIIKGYGDIIIPCAVSDVSFKNSISAPICLINYIITSVLQNNYQEAMEVLEETETLLSQGYYLGLI